MTSSEGPRALALAPVVAESVFAARAAEGGEPERCAFGPVAVGRRASEDPGARLGALARLTGIPVESLREDGARIVAPA
jgi:hypothetical protein